MIVDWDSVAVIVGSISGVIATFAIIAGWVSKYITNQITTSINQFRIEVVETLEKRLTRVEDMIENLTHTKGRDRTNDTEIGEKQ